ncbi:hypothetical protein [Kordia sp.]|uniref:hypothetical protein n=1 Tax=Kordia sp. TaxID=1965332 RepID=UPI0025B9521E|nr:hypothetical protein [Kordia sp.]MCH2196944.1 hypothetical protein [Kordia sp.]
MDNTKAIVYKSVTYNLKGIEEVNDPVSMTITLGKLIHAYEDDEDVLTGYIKFNDEP